MIEPVPCRFMTAAACFIPRKTPRRSTAMVASKPSTPISSMGPWTPAKPALLKRQSSRPKRRTVSSTIAATSASQLTSAWTYTARGPASLATLRPRSSWRSASTTDAPSSRKRRTVVLADLQDERDLTPEPLHPRGPGCSLLLLEVIAGEGRPHVAAREQHRRDDLDRRVAAEALASDGGPRRLATLAEQLDEQIRRAVDHPGLIAEAGRRVHEADHVDDLLHALEVAEGVLDGRQRRERRVARGLVALRHREVLADDARQIALAILPRGRAGEIEEVLHGEVGDVVGARGVRAVEVLEVRDGQAGFRELVVDRHGGLLTGVRRGAR